MPEELPALSHGPARRDGAAAPGGLVRVVGEIMIDTVALATQELVTASDASASIVDHDGGSAANLAAWLAREGTGVELIACIGDDANGDRAEQRLADAGVTMRLRRHQDLPTGRCLVIVTPDGERTMLPDPGANIGLRPDDLGREAWTANDHLHVSGYTLMRPDAHEAARAALDAAHAIGMTVSIDASSAAPLRTWGAEDFLSVCAPGDILFANADEAEVLTGHADAAVSAADLADRGLVAVVKAGPHGAVLARGPVVIQAPAMASTVIDTTGAGDAFAAGFLAAWRAGGGDESALSAATRLAAQAVGRLGARP